MNYIDPSLEVPQTLAINTKAEVTDAISWTLTKEGNDSISFSFSSPSDNFSLVNMKYFQAFSCDFFAEGIDLDPEHSYLLKGAVNGSDVYRGKIFVTEQDVDGYSVNKDKYTEKVDTNNFVILD